METSEASIREILAEVADCAMDTGENADLYSELGLASVHAMLLLTTIEERFNIQLADDDFIEARSISQLTHLVDSLRNDASKTHA